MTMKIRRAEHLVRQIRRQTDNEVVGADDGINTEEILQYINDGQELLQESVVVTHPHIFLVNDTVDTVRGQEEYEMPELAYGDQSLVRIDFAYGSPPDDYRPLKKVSVFEERTYRGTTPYQYIPFKGAYHINPVPDAVFPNGLRRWYNKILPKVDVTRSEVVSSTVVGGVLSALQLTTDYEGVDWDIVNPFDEDDYLCIVGFDGTIKARGIPYSAVDPTTGNVTIHNGSHDLNLGEQIDNGDSVVRGWYASNRSEMAHFCEKYMIEYGSWRVMHRDEKESTQKETQILLEMKQSIVELYSEIHADIDSIPAINYDYSEYL